jgi:thiamine kinase
METGMVRKVSDEQTIAYINQVCGCSQLHFEPVRQGLANSVFRVSSQAHSWAVKLLGPSTFNTVDYGVVKNVQQQLAAIGLAPVVTGYNPDLRIWIEEWIETPEQPTMSVDNLALALARIHQCDITAPTLALLPCWQHYLEQLPLSAVRLFSAERDTLVPVISQFSDYQDFCFCHNDLSFAHLLGVSQNKFVDWEYAATGNRYFDIAACVLINELNSQQQQQLCEGYAEHVGKALTTVETGLSAFLPVVDFTNRLWTAAAKTISA